MGDWVPFPQPGGPANPPHKYQPQKVEQNTEQEP
jgi:hypothetical protein